MKKLLPFILFAISTGAVAELSAMKTGSDAMIREHRKEQLAEKQQLTQALGADTWAYATMVIPTLGRAKKPGTMQEFILMLANQQAAACGAAVAGGPAPGAQTSGGLGSVPNDAAPTPTMNVRPEAFLR